KRLTYADLWRYFDNLHLTAAADEYLKLLSRDVTIHWPAIKTKQMVAAGKGKFAGLQLADCVAGGFRAALDRTHNFTEHRYGKMLREAVYCRNGNFLSYGLKFFPEGPK